VFRPSSAIPKAFLFLATAFCIGAQVNTADVVGNVTDASGAAVAGADVTITDTGTGAARTSKTNDGGGYVFSDLQVGTYTVKVYAQGFAEYEAQNLRLAAGDRARVDAKLAVGEQIQTVEVSATAAALQTDSSSVGNLITDHAVQNLPLNGRNFINLVQLAPGVTTNPIRSQDATTFDVKVDHSLQFNSKPRGALLVQ
jgi:Carboxypeptidase regulatory-like domain